MKIERWQNTWHILFHLMFSFALSCVKLQRIIIPVYIGAGKKHHEIG